MEKFKLSKASITIIIIASILSAIFYFNPKLLLYFPYNIKVWYRNYKVEKEIEKEMDKRWKENMKEIQEAVTAAEEYVKKEKEMKKLYNKLLSSDPYGGKTPEETLKLFVEALKAKDYKLASRYYVPWKWEEMEERMKYIIIDKPELSSNIIDTFENGEISTRKGVIYFYLYMKKADMKYPYRLKFFKNEKTGLWKIEEF